MYLKLKSTDSQIFSSNVHIAIPIGTLQIQIQISVFVTEMGAEFLNFKS
jgi:hypothetical protein